MNEARRAEFHSFMEWASEHYDTAHAYDTERSRWIFWNPMTADLWRCWQAARAAGVPVVQDCETCHGEGTIDERLGGYSFSNPAATCPDCDGTGEGPAGVPVPPEPLLREAADALMDLLDDTQHKQHPDCEEGHCPVRDARATLTKLQAHFAGVAPSQEGQP